MSGGESLRRMPAQELTIKTVKIKEKHNHLKRIGGMENLFLPEEAEQAAGVPDAVVMEPIIGMEDPWRYRNSAVPDRPRKTETDGWDLCRTDPLPDPGTGAGLPA